MALEWWGYLHTNGTIQVKRYFGEADLGEADESPFVAYRTCVIEAENREDAVLKVTRMIKNETSDCK